MIKIIYSNYFLKSVKKQLPKTLQKKLGEKLELIQQNPFHLQLHTKPLTGQLTGFYSFRITRDWRIIFQFENPEVIKLIELGNRKDIYK